MESLLFLIQQEWFKDGVLDSLNMVPFLFVIFLIIEYVEDYCSKHINNFVQTSSKLMPFLGAIFASLPQCGFSVVAATLYSKRYITMGTLMAIFIATSDEAIPVILANPSKIYLVVPLLIVKIAFALFFGYLIDFVSKNKNIITITEELKPTENDEKGCCNHSIPEKSKWDLLIHPIKHTFNVFIFILIITLMINYGVNIIGGEENLGKYFIMNSPLQPIIVAFVGLIPNCAISVAITLLYIKGALGLGATISGLMSSAGLGLLVLIHKNRPFTNTLKIILLLFMISVFSGIIIQAFYN